MGWWLQAGVGGVGRYGWMGTELRFRKMKRVLETDGRDGHTTVDGLDATELYT